MTTVFKWVFPILFLIGCGPGPAVKKFFDENCKSSSKQPPKTAEVEKKEEPEDEPSPTPTPSPTPPDYDNRCSEQDKKQILADDRAAQLHRWADAESRSAIPATPAEVAVSYERAAKDCKETQECSGVALIVAIPPGRELYECGQLNGQNWYSVWCRTPKDR